MDEDFPTDFVLEPSLEKSDYENEDDDEDDPASAFLIPFFQLLVSVFRTSLLARYGRDTNGLPLM